MSSSVSKLDELIHDYLQQVDEGRRPDREAMLREHPQLAADLQGFFADQDRIAAFAQQLKLQETLVLGGGPAADSSGDQPIAPGGLPSSVRYFGRYEILEEIARGGMGVVYKARQARLDRVVALKMILAGQLASSADVSRFYSEAQAAANLEHSGIVPIYEVGQYAGQHYFSMAYVEGESLAARLLRGPLPEREASSLLKQLCEAVQYAHDRGVIHRDLKPANVLLDAAGRPRITDFGLAKKAESDSGLTATGQVLGTPSYMPPEQACGDLSAVGKSADIYALGAVLYAALTGRPPFQAATPIETLLQVRQLDPAPPRVLNPTVSRDLETICLKCLEKDPQARYTSAADMTEDLRRFLADEPILARRASRLAQAARWIRKRQKSVTLAAASTAVAAALIIGGFFAWRVHEQAQLGQLDLKTSGPTLVAQVFDREGAPVSANFPVPSTRPIDLPQGQYEARISSPGLPSESYLLDITSATETGSNLLLESRHLWPPLELKDVYQVTPIDRNGRADLLLHLKTSGALRLIDGLTGNPKWASDLVIDDDGTNLIFDNDRDLLIVGSRRRPQLMAIDSKGALAWTHRGRPTVGDAAIDVEKLKELAPPEGIIVGTPVVVPGGHPGPLVVACYLSSGGRYQDGDQGKVYEPAQQLWVEALGVADGKSRWRYPLTPPSAPLAQWEFVPYSRVAAEQPRLITISEKQIVVVARGQQLHGIDLTTGEAAWKPIELGAAPDMAPYIVGKGSGGIDPLAVVVSGRPKGVSVVSGRMPLIATAFSLAKRRQVWRLPFDGLSVTSWPYPGERDQPELTLAELSDDEPVLIAPTWWTDPAATTGQGGATMLSVFDPASGTVRWEKRLLWTNAFSQTPFTWLVGPDLDGDGQGEVFAAWIGNDNGGDKLVVAALSGRDGHTLWRFTQPVSDRFNQAPGKLCLWEPAEDGWPKLVVPLGGAGGQGLTVVLSSSGGRLLQTLPEVADARSADLDGDGISDLYYTVSPQGFPRMLTVRGAPPTAWRRLSGPLRIADDFDGDGISDLVPSSSFSIGPISGRDGHVLWRPPSLRGNVQAPCAVITESGQSKILALANNWMTGSHELRAFDGRTGHELWPGAEAADAPRHHLSGQTMDGSYNNRRYTYPAAGGCYFDQRHPDIYVAAGDPNFLSALELSIFRGDGSPKWKASIATGQFGRPGRAYRDELADLDGDGVADLVAWGAPNPVTQEMPLFAMSGETGKPLWKDAPPVLGPVVYMGAFDLPTVGDLDGDGAPDVVVVRPRKGAPNTQGTPAEVVCVSGRTGKIKWTWPWMSSGLPNAPPLIVDFNGAGPKHVCLPIVEFTMTKEMTRYESMIVVLDHQGQVATRIKYKGSETAASNYLNETYWWAKADLRGDRRQALLYSDETSLIALSGDKFEPLFKWRFPANESRLLEILPATEKRPATIAVWSGQTIYGISGATGKPVWRGEAPTVAPQGEFEPMIVRVSGQPDRPRLYTGGACRLTWPTDDSGRYLSPPGEPRRYEPVPDPVRLRLLPWVWWVDSIATDVKLAVFTAALVVVPVTLLRLAIRRRSWWLTLLPALWQIALAAVASSLPIDWLPSLGWRLRLDPRVAVALVSVALLVANLVVGPRRRRRWVLFDASVLYAAAIGVAWRGLEGDVWSLVKHGAYELIPVVLMGGAGLASVWFPLKWLFTGRWRALTIFFAAAVVLGAMQMVTALRNDNLLPGEEYSWAGWYFIIGSGIYQAAVLTILGMIAAPPAKWLWRVACSRWRKTPPAAGV